MKLENLEDSGVINIDSRHKDPQMCSLYAADIYSTLFARQVCHRFVSAMVWICGWLSMQLSEALGWYLFPKFYSPFNNWLGYIFSLLLLWFFQNLLVFYHVDGVENIFLYIRFEWKLLLAIINFSRSSLRLTGSLQQITWKSCSETSQRAWGVFWLIGLWRLVTILSSSFFNFINIFSFELYVGSGD